jgi:hypothetical protein
MPARRLAAVACAAVLLAGCLPESENPIAPLAAAVDDPDVAGAWSSHQENEIIYLHVVRQDGNLFQLVWIDHFVDGRGHFVGFDAYITPIGGRRFVNLVPRDGGDSGLSGGHVFGAYEYTADDQLTIRLVRNEAIESAINAGQLRGRVERNTPEADVLITDESARIADFLAAADPAALFAEPLTFQRVDRTN